MVAMVDRGKPLQDDWRSVFRGALVGVVVSVVPVGVGAQTAPPSGDSAERTPEGGAQGAGSPASEAAAAGSADEADWQLSEEDLTMAPIDVVAAPLDLARVGGSAHRISEEELEVFEYNDVQKVLASVPGVYTRGEDGFGLRPNIGLRGVNSDRSSKVTLMEDGILFAPAPYAAPAAYYFPMMQRISAVEVFKGPASVRYGPNTVGGALNLQSRPIPTVSEGALDLAAGLNRSTKTHAHWGTSGKRWGVLLEGAYLQTSGFKELDGGGDTGFDQYELVFKGRVESKRNRPDYHVLEVKAGYADEHSRETYLGLSDDDLRATPYRRYAASARDAMDWGRTQFALSHLLQLRDRFELRTTVYRNDLWRTWDRLDRFRNAGRDFGLKNILENPQGQNAVFLSVIRGEEDSSADQALVMTANKRRFVSQGLSTVGEVLREGERVSQRWEFGARLHFDEVERDHRDTTFAMRSGLLIRDDAPEAQTVDNRGSALAGSLYAIDELGFFGDRWFVTPGMRVELIETRFDDDFNGTEDRRFDAAFIPGIGTVGRVLPWLDLLAGVHRGFSPVAPGQEASIDPESSVSYEAGGRAQRDGLRAEFIGFFNDYQNLTATCTVSACGTNAELNEQFNGGRVFVYGLESELSYERKNLWRLDWRGSASYTLTRSQFRSSFSSATPIFGDVGRGDELPYVPRHQGALRLGTGQERHRWSTTVGVTFVGQMRDVAGQGAIPAGEATDRHTVVDLAADYGVLDNAQLYLTVSNLFANDYLASRRPFAARPGAPLLFLMGYRHRFGATTR